MSFVCLGPRQKIALLDHLQSLACGYEALGSVQHPQNIHELTLTIVSFINALSSDVYMIRRYLLLRCFQTLSGFISTAYHYKSVWMVSNLNHFLKKIQLTNLQPVVLDNYPYHKCHG